MPASGMASGTKRRTLAAAPDQPSSAAAGLLIGYAAFPPKTSRSISSATRAAAAGCNRTYTPSRRAIGTPV
jgi:hypothetical protein